MITNSLQSSVIASFYITTRYILIAVGMMFFSGFSNADDLFSERTLRAGFYARAFPDISVEDIEISVKMLADEIGKNVGITSSVTSYNDIKAMRRAFDQGLVNFVVASPLDFANYFDNQALVDGFRFQSSSNLFENLIVLTRKNEGLDAIASLYGKKLVLLEYDPISDLYMDFLARSTFKKNYKAVFREMPREKRANQVILKLFFGQADVICIYQNSYNHAAELNPQILSKLQIISELRGIPQGIGFFNKNVPADFREKVIAEALNLDSTARGLHLLELFKSNKALRSNITDITATKKLFSDYKSISN